jgi:hypothetical protein
VEVVLLLIEKIIMYYCSKGCNRNEMSQKPCGGSRKLAVGKVIQTPKLFQKCNFFKTVTLLDIFLWCHFDAMLIMGSYVK